MILYLIRHGETDYNKQKRLQGQTDIELNECGRQLAIETGAALNKIKFDYVVSSPLARAVETARLITGENEDAIIKDKRIIEIGFGEYEGLCFQAEGYNIPTPDFISFFHAPETYDVPLHGESFIDVIKRTGDFLNELIHNPNNQDKTILVSTHGCALKAILANIKKTPLKDFWGEGVHKNCAVTIVRIEDGKAEIIEEGKVYYT